MLGEIRSKIHHLAGVPLRPDLAKELHQIFLTKGVMATTAIEGNTLSEEQVRLLVDGKLDLPKSQKYLQQEVQNILDLCNREADEILAKPGEEQPSLSIDLMRRYNGGVLRDLDLEDGVVPGQLRSHSILVGKVYRGAPARDCEFLMNRLCQWLNGSDFSTSEPDLVIPFALIKAIMAHLYLAWIHPFGDGNGRTARMVEFHILLANGVPLPAAHLLSDHYNRTRSAYYRELAHASRSGGDVVPFIKYALQGFLDGLREQISRVREQQLKVTWETFVYDLFAKKVNTKTQKRRLELVLELSEHNWVAVHDIELLNPKLARAYATAGDRMVQRDLNSIHRMGLIERRHGRVRAAKEIIEAFLPRRTA